MKGLPIMKNLALLKINAWILFICIFFNMLCCCLVGSATDDEKIDIEANYGYILNEFSENAYVLFDEVVKENNCDFFDGIEMGITDSANDCYNEISTELSVTGRKFYKANYVNVKINEDFYDEGDNEFLVSVAYYDYGPSEGRFYFDYFIADSEETDRVTIVKAGTVQDWFVKTFYINNADFSKAFDNGANLRLVTGAWNLFKKLEIVNISKLKREKQAARVTLASQKRDALINMDILNGTEEPFFDRFLNESCSIKNAKLMLELLTGKKRNANFTFDKEDEAISQRDLLSMYSLALGVELPKDGACEYAKEIGMVFDEDLFLSDNAIASNYNLLALANNSLLYTRKDNSSLAMDLLKVGILNGRDVCMSGEEKLIKAVFKTPQRCSYNKILDNDTGQMYYNMNIYGLQTWRPYVTSQSWTKDGKRFLCSLAGGAMFLYNIENQTLTYIDTAVTEIQRLHATVGTDDYIYYLKKKDGEFSIWRADANAGVITPELVTNAPPRAWISVPQLSNDCNYISVDYTDNNFDFSSPGEKTFARYNVEEDKWEVYTHTFSYANVLTHTQINPEYVDLIAFSHEVEGSELTSAYEMLDRMWVYNCETGEAKCIYQQGVRETDGTVLQGATHEVWSNDGEYMYFINYTIDGINNVGLTPSAVRYNKDGSHRQYYYDEQCFYYDYKHLAASGDNKYIVADGAYVVLICTETNQHFPISRFVWNKGKSHPYQAHPVIARDKYIVSWGAADDEGILCVRWFDFNNLAKKQAKGGRYSVNEYIDRVSYKKLDCETTVKKYKGKECFYVKGGNALYLDLREELIDTDNGKIKISFEYIDNGFQPIMLTYTSGVETDNDRCNVFDAKKSIKRNNSGKWKTCEFVIDSGNFESIGTYETDIKIGASQSGVYITNLSVEKL